jgi:hypothetical protein
MALALRLMFARYYYIVDDTILYLKSAAAMLDGMYQPGYEIAEMRLSVIVPLSIALYIIGDPLTAIAYMPLFFSLLELVLVFLLGRLLWNTKTGIVAAFLMGIYPLSVLFGTETNPDTIISCALCGGMLCLFHGLDSKSSWYMYFSGFLVGIAYFAKLTGLFIVPVLFFLAIMRYKPIEPKKWAFVILGVCSVVFLGIIFLSIANGYFTFRFTAIATYGYGGEVEKYQHSLYPSFSALIWKRYLPGYFGDLIWPLRPYFLMHGVFGWLSFVIVLSSIIKRSDVARTMLAWWWLLLLLIANFACLELWRPVVGNIEMRYIHFLVAPACLLISAFLMNISAFYRQIIITLLIISSIACSFTSYSVWTPHDRAYQYLFETLRTQSKAGTTIYCGNPDRIDSFVGEGRKFQKFNNIKDLVHISKDDLVYFFINGWSSIDKIKRLQEYLVKNKWGKIAYWHSQHNLVTKVLDRLGRYPKAGLEAEIHIYRYKET